MYKEKLQDLKRHNLYRRIRDRDTSQGRLIEIDGRELLNFSSNDYLGLSRNDELIRAVKEAVQRYGFSAGASRLLSGGSPLHGELEEMIASYKGSEGAIVFNSGYSANIGAVPALTSEDFTIFSDEQNHASLIDGCRLSKAEKLIYRHNDISHLKSLMRECKGSKGMIITESVFSMHGDIANIPEIFKLCKQEGMLLYIDDAHGTGVLGKGRGVLEYFGLKAEDFIVLMGTLSKAIGSIGGYIAAAGDIIDYLINRARSLIYSTALPVTDVAASIASLNYIKRHPEIIAALRGNITRLGKGLSAIGMKTGDRGTPIFPVMLESSEKALTVAKQLFDKGVYAPAIRPPTVKDPMLRLSVTAGHDEEDIEILLKALRSIQK